MGEQLEFKGNVGVTPNLKSFMSDSQRYHLNNCLASVL